MRRLPIRFRLTVPFALAMAVVLAVMGLVVYVRVGDALLASIDQGLARSGTRVDGPPRARPSSSTATPRAASQIAELVSPDGRVLRSVPARLPPLASAAVRRGCLAGRASRGARASRGEAASGGCSRSPPAERKPSRARRRADARAARGRVEPAGARARPRRACGAGARDSRGVPARGRGAPARRGDAPACGRDHGLDTPGARLPVPAARDEISKLAETLNDMLQRLEAAFEHERRFVADASHELRTPLALLRTELELALRRPRSHEELEEALRSAAEETERLTQLAEDLLLIARSDQGELPVRRKRVSAREVLEDVSARFEGGGTRARADRCSVEWNRCVRRRRSREARAGARQPRRQRARIRRRDGRAVRP